jgi:asparagine synthase (glutamine-hydrolysing)
VCGIVGVVGGEISDGVVERMLAAIAHRGPDGQQLTKLDNGRVILGHARLAIIDLSPAGAQPMTLASSDLWITYNGELYNYRELRRELEREGGTFRSGSDTEVLLAGYARWGRAILDRVDGIFAFAMWDGRKRQLWLVRDHLGVKPLYYSTLAGGGIAFASEPKALLEVSPSRAPDPASIRDVLSYGYIPGTRTAFSGISKVAPGTALTWTDGRIEVERYWSVADHAARAAREPSIDDMRELLDTTTAAQLESDVPVGVLVSGGIDSSAIVSSVARTHRALTGFVLGYDDREFDERPYARMLAEQCELPLHERVLDPNDVQALLATVVEGHDEPFADSSSVPTHALFELVRAHRIKVVLGGDGGDELFAGYRRYDKLIRDEGNSQAAWPLKALGATSLRGAARILAHPLFFQRPAWLSYYERIRIFGPDEQAELLTPGWRAKDADELTWPFRNYWRDDLDIVKAAQLFDLQTYLPEDILAKVDRASMHYGVEARVPLLAKRFVEQAIGISTATHRQHGERKSVLKRVVRGRIPDDLMTNRKKGFGLPLDRSVGEVLRNWARSIGESALVRDGVIHAHLGASVLGSLDRLWTLFVLDKWWSRWVHPA